jgi:PAS domain S-box-containing protein
VTDLSSTLRRVLEKLQTLLPLDVFYVALHDPDTQIISFPVMYDMEQFWNQPPGTLSPSGWITQVLQTGQAMLLNRTPEQIEASRKMHKRLGAANQVSASVLMAPLIIGSQNIGVISVQSYTPDAYHEKHLELLVDAGYQIAIAVENARLYDSLRNELAERKQAEEALRRSEALLRALLDATTDVAFLMSLDGTFLTLNKAVADAAGTTVEDLTGRSGFDLIKPELREARRRQFETVIQTRQPQRWEDDTFTGWWDNSVYPVLSPSGSVEAFAVYSRNITEQKRLAAELQRHTARLEEMVEERTVQLRRAKDQIEIILNNIRDAVALAQPNGDIRTANPAFEALFGSHISPSIERILEAIGSDEHIIMVGSALIQAMQLQEQQHIEARITSTDGSSKDVDLTFIPVQLADETGQPGILVSAHDITHLKEIERFKARFIADAVHDLATPISGLSTRLYLLKRSPEKLDEHVCALENQVEHLRNLLADLRTLSQLDRGQLTLNLQTCDLNQIARRVFDTYEPVAITKQQTLKLDAEPSLPEVQLDRRQIERVLVNLVANAINYTPTGKSILMQTRIEAAGVIFGVTDEGIGIAAEELPYIFDRFYRTDRARQTQAGGTGLGLAIVREIMDLHGGTVIVTSEPGRGSTFSISLPIHRPAPVE